jgi:hypothetical protein
VIGADATWPLYFRSTTIMTFSDLETPFSHGGRPEEVDDER